MRMHCTHSPSSTKVIVCSEDFLKTRYSQVKSPWEGPKKIPSILNLYGLIFQPFPVIRLTFLGNPNFGPKGIESKFQDPGGIGKISSFPLACVLWCYPVNTLHNRPR
jgi:hypothetical protein